MEYRVELTDSAKQDLAGIYTYIEERFFSEEAALNTVQNTLFGLTTLELFPTSGFPVAPRIGRTIPNTNDYRGLVLGNHIAFYDVIESKLLVEVDRILYSRQNWIEVLGRE